MEIKRIVYLVTSFWQLSVGGPSDFISVFMREIGLL